MPLIVIALFAISAATGDGKSGSSPSGEPSPLSVSAPPNVVAEAGPCAKLLAQLPVQVNGLDARVVRPHPDTPYVVAWGDPAVILRCGVDRPKSLRAGSTALYVNAGGNIKGPFYDVTTQDGANVYTTVDRAAYISITVPQKYHGTPVAPLSNAILKALPAVCSTAATASPSERCTRRP